MDRSNRSMSVQGSSAGDLLLATQVMGNIKKVTTNSMITLADWGTHFKFPDPKVHLYKVQLFIKIRVPSAYLLLSGLSDRLSSPRVLGLGLKCTRAGLVDS